MNLFILLISLFIVKADCSNMPMVRAAYGNINSEQKLLDFVDLVESSACDKAIPYAASAEMQKAQYALAPWTKYRHFLRGKKELEKFIQDNPNNVEARYIRFLVQVHAPFFLGYNSEIKEDAELIKRRIDQTDLTDIYKKQILDHLEKFSKKYD